MAEGEVDETDGVFQSHPRERIGRTSKDEGESAPIPRKQLSEIASARIEDRPEAKHRRTDSERFRAPRLGLPRETDLRPEALARARLFVERLARPVSVESRTRCAKKDTRTTIHRAHPLDEPPGPFDTALENGAATSRRPSTPDRFAREMDDRLDLRQESRLARNGHDRVARLPKPSRQRAAEESARPGHRD